MRTVDRQEQKWRKGESSSQKMGIKPTYINIVVSKPQKSI